MEKLIKVESAEWLEIYKSFPISGKLTKAHIYDNLFCSMQWMGKDVLSRSGKEHWALEVRGVKVSYLQSYFLSERTIRLRGLCTKTEYQGQGYMQKLISLVLEKYRNEVDEVLCFAGESGKSVCQSAGFFVDEKFKPRYVEFRDSQGAWKTDESSKIILLRKSI